MKPKLSRWEQFKVSFYGYTLMIWDGLDFFGTDFKKLGRLKGENVNFMTALKSPNDILKIAVMAIVALYFILTQFSQLDTLKA